jgi:2-oxoglutarate ferredoxin oxidoreductase subunit gamma
MSQGTYEQNKGKVNPSGGIIFFDAQLIKPDPSLPIKHIPIPATEKALKGLGNRMVANMVLLGAMVKARGLIGEESLLRALSNRVPSSFLELNKKALALGLELGKNERV